MLAEGYNANISDFYFRIRFKEKLIKSFQLKGGAMKKLSKKEEGSTRQNSKEVSGGFTIIEVVLVLAIAGLIFLVVFLALPQLQRARRDAQRKSDVARVVAGLESYAGNNMGRYPRNADELQIFVDGYITTGGSDFYDPSGYKYVLLFQSSDVGLEDGATAHEILYNLGYTCDVAEGTFERGSPRDVAVMVPLEGGIAFCQDNQ